jgi:hypothetical protein
MPALLSRHAAPATTPNNARVAAAVQTLIAIEEVICHADEQINGVINVAKQ